MTSRLRVGETMYSAPGEERGTGRLRIENRPGPEEDAVAERLAHLAHDVERVRHGHGDLGHRDAAVGEGRTTSTSC